MVLFFEECFWTPECTPGALDPTVVQHFSRRMQECIRQLAKCSKTCVWRHFVIFKEIAFFTDKSDFEDETVSNVRKNVKQTRGNAIFQSKRQRFKEKDICSRNLWIKKRKLPFWTDFGCVSGPSRPQTGAHMLCASLRAHGSRFFGPNRAENGPKPTPQNQQMA